jgi:PBP1b-binding outer membrane lipoprotein LpoB
MKKLAILSALTFLLVACTDEKTTTSATVGDTTTVQTSTHTETTTVPTVDTAATAAAVNDAHDTATAAEHNTGTALEKAGKAIKRDAKRH